MSSTLQPVPFCVSLEILTITLRIRVADISEAWAQAWLEKTVRQSWWKVPKGARKA